MIIDNLQPFFDREQAQQLQLDEDFTIERLGSKAVSLITMMAAGLPVPEGFVLDSLLTFAIPEDGYTVDSPVVARAIGMTRLAAATQGRQFGNGASDPYLVSVRSGSAVSMPGMMETVLNIGLNDNNLGALSEAAGPVFALDCYRRLIQMLGHAQGISRKKFTVVYDAAQELFGEMNAEALGVVLDNYKDIYLEGVGVPFPQDVEEQLTQAINAVYSSWFSERAIDYREVMGIDNGAGTAVTVQGMRFGNLNANSAAGVVFTRNPNSGKVGLYGDWAPQAQGEDVVSGAVVGRDIRTLVDVPGFGDAAAKLQGYSRLLDKAYSDMVDIEFTIEDGKVWILQSRVGKRSPEAAIAIAIGLLETGRITKDTAVDRIMAATGMKKEGAADSSLTLLPDKGQPAAGGYVAGIVAFDLTTVRQAVGSGQPYIFVSEEPDTMDTPLMLKAAGLLTATGGKTSHAALCAREWGTSAVVSFTALSFKDGRVSIHARQLCNGDKIAINGKTGEVWVE